MLSKQCDQARTRNFDVLGKNTIKATIVIMSVALIGLIGIQVYWINNAVVLRQQKFQSSVNEALRNVVYQYDKLKTAESLALKMDLQNKRQRLVWQMDSINRAIQKTQDSLSQLQRGSYAPEVESEFAQFFPSNTSAQFQISVYEEYLVDSAGTFVKRSREKRFESPNYGPIRKPVLPESEDESAYFIDSMKQAQTMNLHWLEKRAGHG